MHLFHPAIGLLHFVAARQNRIYCYDAQVTVSSKCCNTSCSGNTETRAHHVLSVTRAIHWLSVRWRISLKVVYLDFQLMSNHISEYLINDLLMDQPIHSTTCSVPWTQNRFADCSFSASGMYLWNALPNEVRQVDLHMSSTSSASWTRIYNGSRHIGTSGLFDICRPTSDSYCSLRPCILKW